MPVSDVYVYLFLLSVVCFCWFVIIYVHIVEFVFFVLPPQLSLRLMLSFTPQCVHLFLLSIGATTLGPYFQYPAFFFFF